ncbi:MAG: phosphate acyltransferase PlsX [Alphaproteobacteria bacterium]|nr:phosphate acyltransferase PlsX [Alphaproteobacteria bacterium]
MTVVIALDAMGGDHAPQIVLAGAELVLSEKRFTHTHNTQINFLLFGDDQLLTRLIKEFPLLKSHAQICHAEQAVTSTTKPSLALRQAAASGMGLAIKAVADGRASAVVSAGNTGAYMALSKMFLKTLDGVDRPAIAKIMPTRRGKSIVLDLGANAECNVSNLVQFGVMGSVLAEHSGLYEKGQKPTIGLLNIGSESSKGLPHLQETASILEKYVNFYGFVEGNDITAGTTDVVVTDGFSGNVALKAIEGTAHLIKHFLKEALARYLSGKIGYLIAQKSFAALAKRMDPRLYNGAILLGLRGIAVKSHGGTDAVGYAEAIKVALDLASNHHNPLEVGGELSFNRIIQERIAQLKTSA